MKTRELLLCLFAFISMNINAMSQGQSKKIDLERVTTSSTTSSKGTRSIFLAPSASFYSDTESILIAFQNGSINAEVSVINLFTNEIIFSDSCSTPEMILNLAGLLNEREMYRLEITIGDTILYGVFDF